MTRDDLLDRLTAQAEAETRVLAFLLGGSVGRDEGDAWSDLDLIAVIAPEDHPGFVEGARAWMERAAPLVLWRLPYPGLPLFVTVTEVWLRCDLTVTVPGRVTSAKDGCRPLVDRAGVWDSLPATLPAREPDPARVAALVEEFIRVLGLMPVVLGRGELVVGVSGVAMQRTALINLMIEELGLPQPPGALHLSRLLRPEDMHMLAGLPAATPARDSVIAANRAIASAFLPRARRLMERVGAPWPDALWKATAKHLERTLGFSALD